MGAGDRINHIQRTDTISDSQGADAPATGIAIGRKCSGIFPRRTNVLERALGQLVVEPQDIITGNPEDVINPGILQLQQQIARP